MRNAHQGPAKAGHAGFGDQQVGLSRGGGPSLVSERPSRPNRRFRLKRSIELFPASDGTLYLLRLGAGDDLSLPDPSADDRLLLEALTGDFKSERELMVTGGRAWEREWLTAALADLEGAGLLEVRDSNRLLPPRQAERYDRQLIYFADLARPGVSAEELQARLSAARVVLVGCGGLGSWVACGLSCAGIASLVLIDDDRVELSNLNRQVLFREDQIGELKISAAAASLAAHNRDLEIEPVMRRIRGPADLDDVLGSDPDLVIATADWPPHDLPRWINEACLRTEVPWIGAGQFPPRLRVGPMVIPGHSACHECLEQTARREYSLYDEIADWRARGETPDASVGAVSGVIGSLLASEAVHWLTGALMPASVGHALLLDLQTMKLHSEPVERQVDCPACGTL